MSSNKPKDLFLVDGITCASFNKDFTQVALATRNNTISIYSIPILMDTSTWKLLYTLKRHTQRISGLDWSPATNKILSCSFDKTSLVWEFDKNKWKSSRVVITTPLGYLCCKWNKRGDKFCSGTSAKQLLIGFCDQRSGWWMARNIRAHRSSVVTCEIDPTSLFVLSGSTDMKIRVSSCYIPEIDDEFLNDETKPLARKFGEIIYKYSINCWVNSVTWLPSGKVGLAAGQNATISVINIYENQSEVIKCKHSPVTQLIPNKDESFYAVCFDRNIYEYVKKGDFWEMTRIITAENKPQKKLGEEKFPKLFKFNKLAKKMNLSKNMTREESKHLHGSLISSMSIQGINMITTDLSGFVKYWKL